MELRGAVALVTGSARGVGRAIAGALASQGAKVAMADVLEEQLCEAASQMQADAATVLPVVTDITEAAEVENMVEQVQQELGPIDVLVNNAGTFSYIGPLWEADPERWMRDIRVNLCGTFLVCRSVVRTMVPRESGYVVNIVSSGGVGDPHPHSTSYASSKAGLMRMTEGLAKEVGGHGIKVFAVAPPAILTEMTRFIMNDPGGKKWRPGFEHIFEGDRAHPPEMVANFILDLLSGKADKLTGRFLLPHRGLETFLAQEECILANDLLTLRIR